MSRDAFATVLYGLFILRLTNAITNRRISNYDYEEPYFFLHFSQSGNRYISLPVTRLVKVQWLANDDLTNRCEISEDPDQVHNSLKGIPHDRVKRVSDRQMEGIINACSQGPHLPPVQPLPAESQKIKPVFIWPGTRWCGTGNVSSGLDDLGWYREEDKCCREHDLCDDIIQAGGMKDELVNDSKYTRLLCSCDDRFWHCLREVNSITSNAIGDFYFNLFQNQCFKMEHPIIQCVTWHSKLLKKRCQEYEFDYTKPKRWQWFDAKVYTKL